MLIKNGILGGRMATVSGREASIFKKPGDERVWYPTVVGILP